MYKDFELAAIIGKDADKELRYISLSRERQDTLKKEWKAQYNSFVDDKDIVNFDPSYVPDKHELFCLRGFKLPSWLAEENSASISDFERIQNNERQISLIKGIAAFVQNETDEEFILFQRFMPAQVIRPSLSLKWDLNTFSKMDGPAFMLANYLSAVYHPGERKLLFHSFYNANIFLSLSDYFKEASEQDIREILSHKRLAPENVNALAIDANQQFRKRFAILKRSGILDKFTPIDIRWRSKEYDISIQLSADNEKIVFPSDKSAAKKLLQFLNDEIFRGPITGDLYETNSRKKVGL